MSDIKPALTAEQWSKKLAGNTEPLGAITEHGVAALCLYGQPFGFTREDVHVLGLVVGAAKEADSEYGQVLQSLADRIEALLPPAPPTEDQ